jgi:DNA invertase Pin-like site-specific DNA recombinase
VLVGYARVSKNEQHLELQLDALAAAGCERVFPEKMTGARDDRPVFREVTSFLRPGDTLVVWRLDRMGRNMTHLIQTVQDLQARGVNFRTLTGVEIDTSSASGKLVFHIFAALAEFARETTRERTLAGLAAARARGRKGGRPRGIDEKKVAAVRQLAQDRSRTVGETCRLVGISRSSYYRYLSAGEGPRPPAG